VDAAYESRRSTLIEAEQDEADELYTAAVWHCRSEIFIVYCGVPTDRCSSAELFILRNPVGVVDGGFVDAVVIAEDGDGATRLVGRRRFHGTQRHVLLNARLEVRVCMHDLERGFFTLGSLPIHSYTLRMTAEAFVVFPFGIPEGCRYDLLGEPQRV
jgi:hypothetical protein